MVYTVSGLAHKPRHPALWFTLLCLTVPFSPLPFLTLPYSSSLFLTLFTSSLLCLPLPQSALLGLTLPLSSSYSFLRCITIPCSALLCSHPMYLFGSWRHSLISCLGLFPELFNGRFVRLIKVRNVSCSVVKIRENTFDIHHQQPLTVNCCIFHCTHNYRFQTVLWCI